MDKSLKKLLKFLMKSVIKLICPLKLHAEDYGVPQKRRRIFIIGSTKNVRIEPPQPLFLENSGFLPKPITVKQAIYGLPPLESGEGVFETEINYKSTSIYEKLMMREIEFDEFYYLVKLENRKMCKNFCNWQPTLFPNFV